MVRRAIDGDAARTLLQKMEEARPERLTGGTVKVRSRNYTSGGSICVRCDHGMMTWNREGQPDFIHCDEIYRGQIPSQPVQHCTNFDDKDIPSAKSYWEKAWIMREKKGKKVAGFISPEERRQDKKLNMERHELEWD